jgi:hypothetical protein
MIGSAIDFIFGFLVLLFVRTREKRQDWVGTVEEKKVRRGFSAARYRYVVIFRKEDGQGKKLRMDQDDFDMYQEGKRYHKKRGEYLPDPESAI